MPHTHSQGVSEFELTSPEQILRARQQLRPSILDGTCPSIPTLIGTRIRIGEARIKDNTREVELPPPVIPVDDEPVDEEIELETPAGVPLRLDPASTAPSSESSVEWLKREKLEEKKRGKRVAKEPKVDLTKLPYPARALQLKRDQEKAKV
ncbi:hypothetical protein E3N88_04325 [Mikania micrantha]|uniref:Uncharacterized protein n=1 Tax=Mikania micrantha TaxID=192012 RepID=A0A5N6PVE5_9ASTR|nr:hypothetical protein E3N88_04325 [Mikania micrantha]